MSIPFLPAPLIIPTFNFIQVPELKIFEGIKLEKLKKSFKKRWISQISPEVLSINDLNIATNNGAESYHSKLKLTIRTSHPRIWSFMGVLNNIIQDVDNDVGRLCQGREISRPQKKKNLMNFERKCTFKQKLSNGDYDPWQFLEAISHTIGNSYSYGTLTWSDSEFSDNE